MVSSSDSYLEDRGSTASFDFFNNFISAFVSVWASYFYYFSRILIIINTYFTFLYTTKSEPAPLIYRSACNITIIIVNSSNNNNNNNNTATATTIIVRYTMQRTCVYEHVCMQQTMFAVAFIAAFNVVLSF